MATDGGGMIGAGGCMVRTCGRTDAVGSMDVRAVESCGGSGGCWREVIAGWAVCWAEGRGRVCICTSVMEGPGPGCACCQGKLEGGRGIFEGGRGHVGRVGRAAIGREAESEGDPMDKPCTLTSLIRPN
jgi:hypothetical protein